MDTPPTGCRRAAATGCAGPGHGWAGREPSCFILAFRTRRAPPCPTFGVSELPAGSGLPRRAQFSMSSGEGRGVRAAARVAGQPSSARPASRADRKVVARAQPRRGNRQMAQRRKTRRRAAAAQLRWLATARRGAGGRRRHRRRRSAQPAATRRLSATPVGASVRMGGARLPSKDSLGAQYRSARAASRRRPAHANGRHARRTAIYDAVFDRCRVAISEERARAARARACAGAHQLVELIRLIEAMLAHMELFHDDVEDDRPLKQLCNQIELRETSRTTTRVRPRPEKRPQVEAEGTTTAAHAYKTVQTTRSRCSSSTASRPPTSSTLARPSTSPPPSRRARQTRGRAERRRAQHTAVGRRTRELGKRGRPAAASSRERRRRRHSSVPPRSVWLPVPSVLCRALRCRYVAAKYNIALRKLAKKCAAGWPARAPQSGSKSGGGRRRPGRCE